MIVWLFLDLFFSTMGWWCLIDMIVEWFLIFGTCDLTRPSLNHLMFQTTYVPFSACSSLSNKVFQVGEFFYLYSNLISLSYQYLNWFCLTEVNTSLLWSFVEKDGTLTKHNYFGWNWKFHVIVGKQI